MWGLVKWVCVCVCVVCSLGRLVFILSFFSALLHLFSALLQFVSKAGAISFFLCVLKIAGARVCVAVRSLSRSLCDESDDLLFFHLVIWMLGLFPDADCELGWTGLWYQVEGGDRVERVEISRDSSGHQLTPTMYLTLGIHILFS